MTVTIVTKYNVGDRVWMPDGNGGSMKGRVTGIKLAFTDLTKRPDQIAWQSLNYDCVDVEKRTYCFHEHQLEPRNL